MPFIRVIYVVCNVDGIKLDCDKRLTLGKATPLTMGTEKEKWKNDKYCGKI